MLSNFDFFNIDIIINQLLKFLLPNSILIVLIEDDGTVDEKANNLRSICISEVDEGQ